MRQASFIISLLGILILLFIVNFIEPPNTKINSITDKRLERQVKITAQVISQKTIDDFSILEIKDSTGTITGICNCKQLPKNQTLKIFGKITKYENEIQITINKITK